ncbi:hypothetical protein IWW38_000049 [Coemansia aciculifera]|uniref:Uncharacterized protein n=1 Tax=Coemansia aciculifera TaxID=417176 RepID=A0ACC1MBW2_9FUNG|nr:hypothetical protein IWW38_000049 [Coemansia aciculifera]
MTQVKYSLIAVFLAVAASSVAEIAEVGYAPQTLVAAQQYAANRDTYMRNDAVFAHGHERAGRAGQESDVNESDEFGDESAHGRDLELSSSRIKDNAATSPLQLTPVFTALLAAGSVWVAAAAF